MKREEQVGDDLSVLHSVQGQLLDQMKLLKIWMWRILRSLKHEENALGQSLSSSIGDGRCRYRPALIQKDQVS